MDADVSALVARYDLEPIPDEGGWFRRTWSSPETDERGRPRGTAIIALWADTDDGFSAIHRLDGTEIWHFYDGDAFDLTLLHPDGRAEHRRLSPVDAQVVVPAGVWMGGSVAEGGRVTLTGATLVPGFDPAGFELGDRRLLVDAYPADAERIHRLTRG